MNNSNVLIVDDEEDLVDGLASYFRRRGQTVTTATTYSAGLCMLENSKNKINVLISDLRMPDGSGIDLILNQIDKVGDRCTCVLMTGDSRSGFIGLLPDRIKVFAKPFSLSAMYEEVCRALETGDR